MTLATIIGYGAHGRDIHEIIRRTHPDWNVQVYDDDIGLRAKLASEACAWSGAPFSVVTDRLADSGCYTYFGPNKPEWRRRLAQRFGHPGPALVDRAADVGSSCELAAGVVVAPGALLLHEVTVGRHTHINYGAMMTRCAIGRYVTIAPGVTICGDVVIGDEVFIGAGAVVKNLVNIGDGATIGAGAVVVETVRPGTIVKGVPAR